MKKIILALAAMFFTSLAHAAPYDSIFRDNAVQVIYTSPGITTSTAAIIIDLSDTTNWPHKQTGSIDIATIWVDFDKIGTSTCTVKIGVVTAVDSSSGTVTYFWVANSTMNHVSTPGVNSPELNGLIRAKVSSAGTTPFILSNNKHTSSTLYQTDVTLPTANGTYVVPAAGDIVLFVDGNAVTNTTVTVHLLYSSER